LCILLLIGVTALGQEERSVWTPPQVLGEGWWQSITVDRQGNTHIAWYGVSDGGDDNHDNDLDALLYTSRAFGGDWTPVNDVIVTGSGGYTVRNALAATSDGILHAVFRAGTRHQFSNALIPQADTAAAWRREVGISSFGYYVDMVADHNDVLHIVYSGREADIANLPFSLEGDICPQCSDLYYRRSEDGGRSWSTPFNLTRDVDAGSDRPSIWEGANGRLFVIWDVGEDWYVGRGRARGVGLRYSDDGGMTWSEMILLDGGGDPDRRPTQIAATDLRDGRLMTVWRYANDEDRQIYFQLTSDLETWTPPEPIEGIYARSIEDCSLDNYELRTDPLGIVHLFVVGQPELNSTANPSLYHIEFRQDRWATRQRVFYSAEARPEWPTAAIGPQGDIHLAWFVRSIPEGTSVIDSCTVGLEVYYSYRGPLLANRPTQAFNPTRTPQPTPTLVHALQPTATALPSVEPVDNPVVSTTRDTYAAQVFVGGTLAVVFFCGGVIAVMRFWRR
jgi:hypothetical protein